MRLIPTIRLMTAIRLAAIAVAFLALSAATVQAKTIFVSPAGKDTHTGLDWTNAKRTVQAGLSAAASGDQVWVAAATYVETIGLVDGVALYGGFAGTETDLSQRDWTANVTILDGNGGDGVVTAPVDATAATRIDGFTIRNGNANDGAGIYCYSSSPTIANNTITNNKATYDGGGIFCNDASPSIYGNTITDNTAGSGQHGGGICCLGSGLPPYPTPRIFDNTISGNSATYGGGIYSYYGSPTIARNTITGNTASAMGGGIGIHLSTGVLVSDIITGNTSNDIGGGIYGYHDASLIANTLLAGNNAAGSDGGGICCDYSSTTIADSTIVCNRAPGSAAASAPTTPRR